MSTAEFIQIFMVLVVACVGGGVWYQLGEIKSILVDVLRRLESQEGMTLDQERRLVHLEAKKGAATC